MIRHHLVLAVFTVCVIGLIFSQVYGQEDYNIPQWVKNNAKLWANDQMGDYAFESGIQYLMHIGIIHVPLQAQTASETKIPAWVKNTAGWWADGKLSDGDFINGIGYLIKTGQIQFKTASIPATTTPATSNATISQNFVPNIHLVPTTVTKPVVKQTKIFLLVTNWPIITQGYPYSFKARAFDASQINPNLDLQDTFNQQQGFLDGVRIQAELLSYDNKTVIFSWNGTTNQFGYFEGQHRMQNELPNQVYFVHFNATKSGMIPDSKHFQFQLVLRHNILAD